MKILLILFLIYLNSYAYTICPDGEQECQVRKVHILDTKKITSFNDRLSEFSALVLKGNTLYVLSDKGRIIHFDFFLKGNKIEKLQFKASYDLKDKKGKRLSKKYRDSEGIDTYEDQLLISFEGYNRVESYDFYGNYQKSLKLNKRLRKNDRYASKNKGLESVAYNSLYGVVTAPEKPLNKKKHKIYSRDFVWKFKAIGNIVDMEFIDTHNLMVLMQTDFTSGITTSVLKINLSSCKDQTCSFELLAKMSSADGWNIDNFEGIEKVEKNRYLMVSDDNDSFFQNTLLVLFEIVKR